MIVVGFSATDGTTGMIDASTTRNPSIHLTAPCESTTAHGSWGPPIGAVAAGWPEAGRREGSRYTSGSGRRALPVARQVRGDRVRELVVPDCVAGNDLELDELSERRIAAELAGQLHPFEHPTRVPGLRQEVAVALRLLA